MTPYLARAMNDVFRAGANDIEPDITAQLDMATQSETIEETSADEVEKEVERNVSSKMKILNSGIDCGHPRQSPTRRS